MKVSFERDKVVSVKELLVLGTNKGFLTFKEIDDGLSKHISDKDEIDAILSLIEQSNIEIVENEKKYQTGVRVK